MPATKEPPISIIGSHAPGNDSYVEASRVAAVRSDRTFIPDPSVLTPSKHQGLEGAAFIVHTEKNEPVLPHIFAAEEIAKLQALTDKEVAYIAIPPRGKIDVFTAAQMGILMAAGKRILLSEEDLHFHINVPDTLRDFIQRHQSNHSYFPEFLLHTRFLDDVLKNPIYIPTISEEEKAHIEQCAKDAIEHLDFLFTGTEKNITASGSDIKRNATRTAARVYHNASAVQVISEGEPRTKSGVNEQPVKRPNKPGDTIVEKVLNNSTLAGARHRLRDAKELRREEKTLVNNISYVYTAYESGIHFENDTDFIYNTEFDSEIRIEVDEDGATHCIDTAYVIIQGMFDGCSRTVIIRSRGVELPLPAYFAAKDHFKETTVGDKTALMYGGNTKDPMATVFNFENLREYTLIEAVLAARERFAEPHMKSKKRAKFETLYIKDLENEKIEMQAKVRISRDEMNGLIERLKTETKQDPPEVRQFDRIFTHKGENFPMLNDGQGNIRLRYLDGKLAELTTKIREGGALSKKVKTQEVMNEEIVMNILKNRNFKEVQTVDKIRREFIYRGRTVRIDIVKGLGENEDEEGIFVEVEELSGVKALKAQLIPYLYTLGINVGKNEVKESYDTMLWWRKEAA